MQFADSIAILNMSRQFALQYLHFSMAAEKAVGFAQTNVNAKYVSRGSLPKTVIKPLVQPDKKAITEATLWSLNIAESRWDTDLHTT